MDLAQILSEKAVNFKTFAATLKTHGDTAKVGFEFEMMVPLESMVDPEWMYDAVKIDG